MKLYLQLIFLIIIILILEGYVFLDAQRLSQWNISSLIVHSWRPFKQWLKTTLMLLHKDGFFGEVTKIIKLLNIIWIKRNQIIHQMIQLVQPSSVVKEINTVVSFCSLAYSPSQLLESVPSSMPYQLSNCVDRIPEICRTIFTEKYKCGSRSLCQSWVCFQGHAIQ